MMPPKPEDKERMKREMDSMMKNGMKPRHAQQEIMKREMEKKNGGKKK